MTIEFFAMLTNAGAAKVADSIANGTPIVLDQIAVGDGDHTPNGEEIALVNQQWIGDITTVERDLSTPTLVKAELTIPTEDGGWWVKEIGVFDSVGDLFAIAKCPPSYKPITAEGSPKPMPIRFYLYISVDANVDLFTGDPEDPATIGYVQSLLSDHEATPHADFADGDILLCGNDAAPTGWHKVSEWQDNSMLVFTTGSPAEGGSGDPKGFDPNVVVASHPAHTHDLGSHRHSTGDHQHSVVVPMTGWGERQAVQLGQLMATVGAPQQSINGNRTLNTAAASAGNTGYSGVLTTGNPSATLSHGVIYSSYAPKYRSVIAIRKGEAA